MVKQTVGRDSLGDFAPQFAQLNDDVLFGQVWNQEGLSLKLRSILTVTALVSKGLIDSSFQYHLTTAKQNGVTRSEMAAILTHLAFYAGWPNAWAASTPWCAAQTGACMETTPTLGALGKPFVGCMWAAPERRPWFWAPAGPPSQCRRYSGSWGPRWW